ncbi:energy transducer TonB [Mucilaginibacter pedocola]|uniref:TonB C-terminal domain-containing protein n=1 Tax=Mucilaginibacter pedocola TaxID=1792845 RepID=A0A1S9PMP9_9SPHI|nr:energy transducer TonB [Mucilaginibacter pedocola]OOQ61868.1 hypothetical protein BC343_02045 [Mucilaginibacter pedocola]
MQRVIILVGLICFGYFATAQQKLPKINPKDTTVYSAVDQQPQFGIDENAFNKYIVKNLNFQPDTTEELQWRVIASFIVEKDGSVSHIKVLRPKNTRFEKAFVDMLKAAPKWQQPAIHEGYYVRCEYSVPIHFHWASKYDD